MLKLVAALFKNVECSSLTFSFSSSGHDGCHDFEVEERKFPLKYSRLADLRDMLYLIEPTLLSLTAHG